MLLTKIELRQRLEERAAARGGELESIGGDCYVVVVEGEIRLGIALKETSQPKKIWLGNPRPLLDLILGRVRVRSAAEDAQVDVYRMHIVLTHLPFKSVVTIPILQVYEDIVERAASNRAPERTDFDVKMVGYKKYEIQTSEFIENIRLPLVDDLESFLEWIDIPVRMAS